MPTKSWDVSKRRTNVGERHGSKISLQNREFAGFGERWRMSTNAGASSMWWARQDSNLQLGRYERQNIDQLR